jgi:hypothetical protein
MEDDLTLVLQMEAHLEYFCLALYGLGSCFRFLSSNWHAPLKLNNWMYAHILKKGEN